jgi:hypothetical protein
LEGGGHDVAVAQHVRVLIGGHPHQALVGHRVIARAAGVAMGDPGGQFLEGGIGQQPQRRLVRHPPLLQGGHRSAFQGDGVDVAGDQQIVAEHDRVAALLGGGPSVRPGPPGPVTAEAGQQLVVVAGQVVLGEQVDLEGGLGDPVSRGWSGPGLDIEVAAQPPAMDPWGSHALAMDSCRSSRRSATGSNSARAFSPTRWLPGGLRVRSSLPGGWLSFRAGRR